MRSLIALFAMMLTWMSVSAENQCRIFNCGSIASESDTNQTCVHIQTTANHIVATCRNDNYTCGANSWTNPTQANANKTCFLNKDPALANYTRLAGETCFNSTQCFNSNAAVNASVCEIPTGKRVGFCRGNVPINGACTRGDSRYCNAGAYCLSSNNTCQAAKTEGQVCSQTNLCRFGLICVASNDAQNNFTCHKSGSLTNNQNFTITYVEEVDEFFGVNSLCPGHTVNNTDSPNKRTCRPGDLSDDQNESQLKRSGVDQICNFTTFHGPGILANQNKSSSELAECGFNKDSSAWCRKRKGDKWFQEAYKKFIATDFSQLYCHSQSKVAECYEFHYGNAVDIHTTFANALFEVSSITGFARVANNDDCVAKSVTANFWMGRSPLDAYNTGIAVASAIILAMNAF